MTPTAQERLDSVAQLEAADPSGMLRQVASAAAQIRRALRATEETDLSPVVAAGRPRAIVACGMGGSGLAAEVLKAVCGGGCAVPVVAVHDYQLPGWVGAADLVFAVSSSGSAEETLAVAAEAVRRGCPLAGIGPPGSPLGLIAEQARAPYVPIERPGMYRAGLWGLSVPLLVIAARLGLAEVTAGEFETTAATLERISYLCRPDSEAFVNPAKTLALEMDGTLPMIWGSSPLAGVAALRFAYQLNEDAKYPAVHGVLPEANHNQVVAFDGPFAPWPASSHTVLGDPVLAAPVLDEPGLDEEDEPRPPVPLRLVILRDTVEHPQAARRREASAELAGRRGIEVSELAAEGDRPLQRLASLIQLIDYSTVYLGIAIGVDPGPVAAIGDLKDRIA
ncbi:MAG TPA: SIS domain-containing protein [Streptosporangiaceae bacterium]|nr:SIS domain-containing protein [Streptosporangiaceae bacterium]